MTPRKAVLRVPDVLVMPRSVSFSVIGQVYSMKNSKHLWHQHPKAKAFQRDFAYQVPIEARNLMLGSENQPLRVNISVWYPSRRQDLDVSLVLDCLQANGVISNDRYVTEIHAWGHVDPKNPHCDVTIEEI